MNLKLLKVLFVFGILICFSCSNDDYSELLERSTDNVGKTKKFILKADYEGKSYDVPCLLLTDKDSIVFLDEEFKELFYNKIAKTPNLLCKIKENGRIEYTNGDDFNYGEIGHNKSNTSNPIRRVAPSKTDIETKTFLHFWVDHKFKHAAVRIELKNNWQSWECPDLRPIGWDNTISSLIITNKSQFVINDVRFLGYDGYNYTGECLTFDVEKQDRAVTPNIDEGLVWITTLTDIPMKDGSNWNDKLSSIKFFAN